MRGRKMCVAFFALVGTHSYWRRNKAKVFSPLLVAFVKRRRCWYGSIAKEPSLPTTLVEYKMFAFVVAHTTNRDSRDLQTADQAKEKNINKIFHK
jgi:hypothetical protein